MKVFATRVWGFGTDWPIITFTREGDRNNLIRNSLVGDRIVFVATQGEPVPVEDRGRILGMAEIGRRAVDTLDVLDPAVIKPHDYDERGQFRWPKALLMVRAWRFPERPFLKDVLSKQLPYNATSQAVELSAIDAQAIMSLQAEELNLAQSDEMIRLRNLDEVLKSGRSHGPAPGTGSGVVNRSADQIGFTYCFRFGKSDAWKIGRTVDVAGRRDELNKNIPIHVTGHHWEAILQHRWPDLNKAHQMEQRVLDQLECHSIGGEMVRCSQANVEKAWNKALFG